ncbi:MAG: hypothetical protein GY869_28480 [Planctomycetes bacterium]|nr:hypothetical protein [Planctomycetota bacterium]
MSLGNAIKGLVRRLFAAEVANIHTHIPAQVVSYTAATNLAVIQPSIMRIRSEDPNNLKTVQLPQIEDVPVQQVGSGLVLCTCAPVAGSYGTFHVCERSLENWIVKGGIEPPTSARKFDISVGFFQPGAYPLGTIPAPVNTDRIEFRTLLGTSYISLLDTGAIEIESMNLGKINVAITGDITLESAGGKIELASGGTVTLNSGVDAAALATRVDLLWTTLYTLLTTWVPVPADGGAAFKAASVLAFPAPPTSVASTKLKVDL